MTNEHTDADEADEEIIYRNGEPFIMGNGIDPDDVRLSTYVSNLAISIADDADADVADLDAEDLVLQSSERLGEDPLDDECRIEALRNVIIHLNAWQGLETDLDELPTLEE